MDSGDRDDCLDVVEQEREKLRGLLVSGLRMLVGG